MYPIIVSMIGIGRNKNTSANSSKPYVCFSPNLSYVRKQLIKEIKRDFEELLEKAPILSNDYTYNIEMYMPKTNKWFSFSFKGIDLMKKGVLK